jgi:hypothetical protein
MNGYMTGGLQPEADILVTTNLQNSVVLLAFVGSATMLSGHSRLKESSLCHFSKN